MAKIDVKVIDMEGGEVTKIKYAGEEYVNVGKGGGKPGDIGLRIRSDVSHAKVGSYYRMVDDRGLSFIDEVGDKPFVFEGMENFVYFRKPSVQAAPEPAEEVTETTEAPREGDYVVFEISTLDISRGKPYKITGIFGEESFKFEDDAGDGRLGSAYNVIKGSYKLYRPIEGAPKVGDKILVVDADDDRYDNGDIFTVDGVSPRGNAIVTSETGRIYVILRREFEIIERAGEEDVEETIEEGDDVRVTGETYYGDFEEGTIAIVSYFDDRKMSKLARIVIETEYDLDRTSADNLVLVAKKADREDV